MSGYEPKEDANTPQGRVLLGQHTLYSTYCPYAYHQKLIDIYRQLYMRAFVVSLSSKLHAALRAGKAPQYRAGKPGLESPPSETTCSPPPFLLPLPPPPYLAPLPRHGCSPRLSGDWRRHPRHPPSQPATHLHTHRKRVERQQQCAARTPPLGQRRPRRRRRGSIRHQTAGTARSKRERNPRAADARPAPTQPVLHAVAVTAAGRCCTPC